jgi:hypothetical protein
MMARRGPGSTRSETWLRGLLLFVLGFYSLCYLYHAGRLVLYPYTIDYGEGFLLNQGKAWSELRSPYQSIDGPPWLVANYPPVYSLAVGAGIKFFGLQYHFGRFLSVVGVLATAFCLYRMVLFESRDRFCAWVAALLWMTSYPVYVWGTHHRVDSFGIGLEAVGLLLLLRRNHLNWAIVFFLLSLYTRQTLWMGPLAGYFYLRRTDSPKFAAWWFFKLLLSGGAIFGAMTLLTGGEFYRHLISYNANEYNIKDVWRMWNGAVVAMMFLPTLFGLFYLFQAVVGRRWNLAAISLPFAYLTYCLVGKLGSATNYLYELAFASAWATALLLAEIKEVLPRENLARLFPTFLLAVGIIFPVHVPHLYGTWGIYDWGGTPIGTSHLMTEELVARLKEKPAPVFSQDSGVSLLAGHPLLWQPFIMTTLAKEKRWDPAPFHRMLKNKELSALVMPIDLDLNPRAWAEEGMWWSQFNEETSAIIHENYRVEPRMKNWKESGLDPRLSRGYRSPFGDNYLYVPR